MRWKFTFIYKYQIAYLQHYRINQQDLTVINKVDFFTENLV